MTAHLLLIHPSANRVYAEQAVPLMVAELTVLAARALATDVRGIEPVSVAGVPYVRLETDGDLTERDLAWLANLSSLYAVFAAESGDDPLLRPVPVTPLDRLDSDLLTILKYAGKTNEQFTRLLVNLTAWARPDPTGFLDAPLRLLDPLAGRGTTLNQAMTYGWDAVGVDVDRRDVEAYDAFLLRWLRDKRLKHTAERGRLRLEGKAAPRLHVTYAEDKAALKAGGREVTMINADTRNARRLLKDASFDLVVTDTPYGVQHASVKGDERLARRPDELLAEAVPDWTALLRPGGAMGLSYNQLVVGRDHLVDVLTGAGLEVATGPGYDALVHRVDASIRRDVVVAVKP